MILMFLIILEGKSGNMNYFKALKKTIPILWTDKVKITGTKPVVKNHITNNVSTTIVENEPAKVSL